MVMLKRKPVAAIKATRTELIGRLRLVEERERLFVVKHTPRGDKMAAEHIARLKDAIAAATKELKKRGAA